MKLFVAIAGHSTLLPHFLRHYAALGVEEFFIGVEPALEAQVRRLSSEFPVTLVSELDSAESIEGGTAAVTQMRMDHAGNDEWVLLADLDEFQVHPVGLRASVAGAEAEGANVIRGYMVDRVATDGRLRPVPLHGELWTEFPERCYVTARLQRGLSHKCALVKGHLASGRTGEGLSLAHHHMVGERIASSHVEIHHFKWSAEALDRMRTAITRARSAGQPFWVEYQRVLDHLERYGRLRWEDFAAPLP